MLSPGFQDWPPLWGPTGEDFTGWVKNRDFWVTSNSPWRPFGLLLDDHLVTMGVHVNHGGLCRPGPDPKGGEGL